MTQDTKSTPKPSYEEMMEYVLDEGRECECCKEQRKCKGIICTPKGEMLFPACSTTDFSDLLLPRQVGIIYREGHANETK